MFDVNGLEVTEEIELKKFSADGTLLETLKFVDGEMIEHIQHVEDFDAAAQ